MPVLPARRLPTGPDTPVLDVARLDRSGRVSARPLLAALGWRPGHRVDIDVVDGVVVVAAAVAGRHMVSARSELTVPAATGQLCGIERGSPVLLAGYPAADLVVIHPVSIVARLLRHLHTGRSGAHRVR
jgi:hypothetical protein